MLIGNYSIINKAPGRGFGGATNPRGLWKNSLMKAMYMSDASLVNVSDRASVPNGYAHEAWLHAQKAGGLGSNAGITIESDMTASMAAGKALEAALSGSATISSATVQLVVSMVANLSASGVISNAQAVAILQMVANLDGSASVAGTLTAIGHMVASVTANASMSPQMNATANMEADITPFTELSPESLAASVWNALAAEYNSSGTMGEKLNAAGTAGDPWTTDLTSYNTANTAGKILKDNPAALEVINSNVKKASKLIPASEDI